MTPAQERALPSAGAYYGTQRLFARAGFEVVRGWPGSPGTGPRRSRCAWGAPATPA
ncbi:MAG: hypothetical protein AB7N76_36545 [Planctomycetota bacterium]